MRTVPVHAGFLLAVSAALLTVVSCTSPEEAASLAHAQELIRQTNADPAIQKAVSDWNGPDRRFGAGQIAMLAAGKSTRADVERIMGPPTKRVPEGDVETWNYRQTTKGFSIWGNAVAPRLFEPSREYALRASLILKDGVLTAFSWSTDVMQVNYMRATVGMPFAASACESVKNGSTIDEVTALVGEPPTRRWYSDGRQEIGYLRAENGTSIVAQFFFENGKLVRRNIITNPPR